MKKILKLALIAILALGSHSCNDWMNVAPEGEPTLDDAFQNRAQTERFLFTVYSYLPIHGDIGAPSFFAGDDHWILPTGMGNHGALMGSGMTSGVNPWNISRGFQGTAAPLLNYWDGGSGAGRSLWQGIRDAHIFLENIHKPLDLNHFDRQRWIAETTFLKAYYHFYLMQLYGAIPIMEDPIPVGAPVEQVRVFRDPVSDVVEYIVRTIDRAMPDLPLIIDEPMTELGRITQPIAAAVKAQVLLFYASPLMNGNPDFAHVVDSRGVHLFPREDRARWERAAEAAREAIDLAHQAGFKLFRFQEMLNISETTRTQMSIRGSVTEWFANNTETIWPETRAGTAPAGPQAIQSISTARPFDPNPQRNRVIGGVTTGGNGTMSALAPTLEIAEMFHSSNGVPIGEDRGFWADNFEYRHTITTIPDEGNNRYLLRVGERTAMLHLNREPRFYANLTFSRSTQFQIWMLTDADPRSVLWHYNLMGGQVGGNANSESFSVTGYVNRTMTTYRSDITGTPGTLSGPRFHFPIIRLADLYLMYAEARNESLAAPDATVHHFVDEVRQRAGLNGVVESWAQHSIFPGRPLTQDGMRAIIRRERLIELSGEGKRFWDMRRWKEHRTEEVKGWNAIHGRNTDDFYQVVTLFVRPRQTVRDYLWPISTDAIIKNPNLVQNPGW
ncbi:MAG: RagB/SusD family nutrient uptake outer membrane protein [Dysgonamonadaceae bacterium]|jgi:hypothetical protein|nr:RagB/SusD family nutrient uptake outer membrane protein [Dysgonamonadaceae bacterium]